MKAALIAVVMFGVQCFAGTRILDVMYNANGDRENAQCTVAWSAFTGVGGKAVGGGQKSFKVSSGVVDISLEPTKGVSSPPTAYALQCSVVGSPAIQRETWDVPNISQSDLSGVRVSAAASGPSTTAANFADGIIPTGAVDGSNITFVLPGTPNPSASLALYRNGLLMQQGGLADYLISGGTITFMNHSTPQTGDILLAFYRY